MKNIFSEHNFVMMNYSEAAIRGFSTMECLQYINDQASTELQRALANFELDGLIKNFTPAQLMKNIKEVNSFYSKIMYIYIFISVWIWISEVSTFSPEQSKVFL